MLDVKRAAVSVRAVPSCLLEYRRYALPFRHPIRTGHGLWSVREGVLLRLSDAGGRAGYGEAAPVPGFGTESVDEILATLADLGGNGAQVDEAALGGVPERCGCLLAGVAAALSGLTRSRAQRDPETPRGDGLRPVGYGLPARHAWLPLAALLPAGRAALERVDARLEAGFRTFKWKVGVAHPREELPLLDDLLARLPSGARLRLDANGAWDTRTASRWLEAGAERPIEYVEQPVAADARGAEDALLGLAGDFPTPLALDESLVGAGDIAHWLDLGWPGWWVLKPALLGDPSHSLEPLLSAGGGAAQRVVFSSALETAVGACAALRLAATWPWEGTLPALGFGVYPLFSDARADGPPAELPGLRTADLARFEPDTVWTALH